MAERSVRARRANMQLYTPQETAAPAEAIQRGMAKLSNSMDRMSQFFGEQARVQAEIEGAQYGARNAPTAEQLQDAFQSGEELELPGGFGTVFDRAARKAALDITQTEVEFEARKRINDIITTATRNGTNPATILDDIDAVTHGFAATFDDSSPGVARKLRAGLSIWANGKMASYENSYIADQKTNSQSNWISNMLGMFEGFDQIISTGIPTGELDPETGEQTVRALTASDMIALKLGKIEEAQRKGFPPSSLTTIGNLFDQKVIEAANRVLIDSVLLGESPRYAITAIGRGQVDGLDMATQNAVATLRGQGLSFSDIAQEVRDRRIDELQYVEAENDSRDKNSEKLEDSHVAKAMEAMIEGDISSANSYILLVKTSNPVLAATLQKEWIEAGERRTTSNPDVINALDQLQSNISYPDVANAFDQLNKADREKYYKRAEVYQREEVKTALTFMKGALLLPANIDAINDADPNFEKVNIFRKLAGELAMEAASAKSLNVDFDAREVSMRLLEGVVEDLNEADKRMKITSGNLVIDKLSGQGNYDLQAGDFQKALEVITTIIAAKEARNNNAIPSNLRSLNLQMLRNLKKSLMEAMQ